MANGFVGIDFVNVGVANGFVNIKFEHVGVAKRIRVHRRCTFWCG